MKALNLLVLVGSLREKSYNRALARHIKSLMPSHVTWVEPDLTAFPFFNEDLEGDRRPPSVVEFHRQCREASGVLVVSPEYNWSMPALIKNAIDWGSRPTAQAPLGGKVFFLCGASQGPVGTARMHLALRQCFGWTKNRVWNPHDLLVSFAQDKFDDQGRLIDQRTAGTIQKQLEGYLTELEGG